MTKRRHLPLTAPRAFEAFAGDGRMSLAGSGPVLSLPD